MLSLLPQALLPATGPPSQALLPRPFRRFGGPPASTTPPNPPPFRWPTQSIEFAGCTRVCERTPPNFEPNHRLRSGRPPFLPDHFSTLPYPFQIPPRHFLRVPTCALLPQLATLPSHSIRSIFGHSPPASRPHRHRHPYRHRSRAFLLGLPIDRALDPALTFGRPVQLARSAQIQSRVSEGATRHLSLLVPLSLLTLLPYCSPHPPSP